MDQRLIGRGIRLEDLNPADVAARSRQAGRAGFQQRERGALTDAWGLSG
jgi:hypothetical protein